MPVTKTRKPQRQGGNWFIANKLSAKYGGTVTATLTHASALTCRDCFGFGHSKGKCPTAAKLDGHRKTNGLLCSVISRFRTDQANKPTQVLNLVSWPLLERAEEDYVVVQRLAS